MPWRREVEAQHLGDAAQAELGGAVGGVPGQAEQAGGRRDVDEVAAAAGGDHRRQKRLDHVDRAHQVDVDDAPPLLVRERLDRSPDRDPGDVHDDVDAAVRGVDLVRHRRHRRVVGDVEGLGVTRPRPPPARISSATACERRVVDVGEEEPGALARRRRSRSRGRCRWRLR